MAAVGKAAAANISQWDTKKHIAYSHVAHLGVDNVLFALVSGVISRVVEQHGKRTSRTYKTSGEVPPIFRYRHSHLLYVGW